MNARVWLIVGLTLTLAGSANAKEKMKLRSHALPSPEERTPSPPASPEAAASEEPPASTVPPRDASAPVTAPPATSLPPALLLDIHPRVGEGGATVLLSLSRPVPFASFKLEKPSRLVVDLMETKRPPVVMGVEIGSPWLQRIRVAQHEDPLRTRVVLDLPQAFPYRVESLTEGRQILVEIAHGPPLTPVRFQGVKPQWGDAIPASTEESAKEEEGASLQEATSTPTTEESPSPNTGSKESQREKEEQTSGREGGKQAETSPKEPSVTKDASSQASASPWEGQRSPSLFRIDTNEQVGYRTFFLKDPPRIVVDLLETRLERRPPPMEFSEGVVRRVRVGQFDATTTRVVFDLRRLVGYRVEREADTPTRLWVHFSPASLQGWIVVIDPGHGGKDPGTSGVVPEVVEKEITLDIALRLARLLEAQGMTVMLTRSEDVYPTLQERVDFANRGGADLFLSIHCNAFPQPGARCGVEIYYWTPQSAVLAEIIREEYIKAVGRPDRGVRNNRKFFVLRHTNMPSVLIETGYLDHAVEGRLLNDPHFRQRAAQGLCNGVMRYLSLQPPRRVQRGVERSPEAPQP